MEKQVALDELAAAITKEHKAATEALGSALEHAKACGDLLRKAKARVSHGEWKAWVETNCPFSFRWSQHYMRIAREWSRIDAAAKANPGSFLGVKKVLAMLARGFEDEASDTAKLNSGGNAQSAGGDEEEADDQGGYTKSVILTLAKATHEEFTRMVAELMKPLGTRNVSLTVVAAVRQTYNLMDPDDDAESKSPKGDVFSLETLPAPMQP